jgi:hypothetical protein
MRNSCKFVEDGGLGTEEHFKEGSRSPTTNENHLFQGKLNMNEQNSAISLYIS